MSARELKLDGGKDLAGNALYLRIHSTPDGTCVTMFSEKDGIIAVLDRQQTRKLIKYLQERLER